MLLLLFRLLVFNCLQRFIVLLGYIPFLSPTSLVFSCCYISFVVCVPCITTYSILRRCGYRFSLLISPLFILSLLPIAATLLMVFICICVFFCVLPLQLIHVVLLLFFIMYLQEYFFLLALYDLSNFLALPIDVC